MPPQSGRIIPELREVRAQRTHQNFAPAAVSAPQRGQVTINADHPPLHAVTTSPTDSRAPRAKGAAHESNLPTHGLRALAGIEGGRDFAQLGRWTVVRDHRNDHGHGSGSVRPEQAEKVGRVAPDMGRAGGTLDEFERLRVAERAQPPISHQRLVDPPEPTTEGRVDRHPQRGRLAVHRSAGRHHQVGLSHQALRVNGSVDYHHRG